MELNIKGSGNTNQLIKMLAWIEFCGNIGHTPKYLKSYIDGDGSTRWKFEFKDEELQDFYEETKNYLLEEWNINHNDLDCVEL